MKFLVFENNIYGRVRTGYFVAKVMAKDRSFVVDGHNLFNKTHIETYESFRKLATGYGYNYNTGCLLFYSCFKKH